MDPDINEITVVSDTEQPSRLSKGREDVTLKRTIRFKAFQ